MHESDFVGLTVTGYPPLCEFLTDGLPAACIRRSYEMGEGGGRRRIERPHRKPVGPGIDSSPVPSGISLPRKRHATPLAADLVLYVSGNSLNSIRAVRSLRSLIDRYPPDALKVRIVDVADDVTGAARDRVIFTPTLIITDSAERTTRLLGSLSNADVLADLLRAVGLEPE
jgi:circadian clock protein KaiB